jgi:tetratricopeptide (TPR) repeat protein
VRFHWQISAGEFFELLRPGALVVSALLSTWVFAGARRWRFRFATAIAWALGTFLFPFIVLPIYLIARASARRSIQLAIPDPEERTDAVALAPQRFRFALPTIYGLVLLSLIGIYLYRDYQTVDAHLARAVQAKVMNNRTKAIREYRAALRLEDNPHTHKLLGMELAETQQWAEALREFRAAEDGGEPDDSVPFRIAQVLEASGQTDEALTEFKKFLNSRTCTDIPPDSRCTTARDRVSTGSGPR